MNGMNILLIGGAGNLTDQIIIKLKKEGHKVFLLTGSPYKKQTYEKVFETYRFAYDSDVLDEVVESVNPDVTICMGAFDTNYDWKEEEREAVRYTAHLTNILVMHAKLKKEKVILLSSHEVYQAYDSQDILEEMPTSGTTVRAKALIQAEAICEEFRQNWGLDIVVLRLDHLHSIPKDADDIHNICAKMCLESMKHGYIKADIGHEFRMLSEKDAVSFLYQVIKKQQHKYNVYHLCGEDIVNEVQLAGMIEQVLGNGANMNVTQGSARCRVLNGSRFQREYGTNALYDSSYIVKQIASHMKKHASVFLEKKREKMPWWKRILERWKWLIKAMIPFAENLICFIPFFMLNNRTVGSEYFANLDPYLLYVLLFAILYGQQQATFSATCAVAGYLFRQMYNRTGFEVILDYNTYVWIAQLFILGLVVGYMRDQIQSMKRENQEMEEYLNQQIVDIKDINRSNVRVKEILEQQLIDHKDSIGKIYSITSRLEQQIPEDVLFDAVEMLKELMHTEDVAIYNVENEVYVRMFSASSEKARSLGNSIRCTDLDEIYQVLTEQSVYINKQLKEEYPMMAKAIYEGGKIQMIIMLWGLSWEQMTLGQANFLTVVSYLVQNAVLRARRYMTALEEKRYIGDSGILDSTAFVSLVESYFRAKEKNLVQCTLLKVLEDQERYSEIAGQMSRLLRTSDYMGMMQDEKLYILLANTEQKDAYIVQDRFTQRGYGTEIVEKVEL